MLVVIAICSVIMAAGAVCLHGVYRAEQEYRKATALRRAISRLSLQFRADVHAARAARAGEGDAGRSAMIVEQPDGRAIEYRWEAGRIVREVKRSERVVHQDAYLLPRETRVEWRVGEAGPSTVAAVVISRGPELGVKAESIPGDRIEAVVGLAYQEGQIPQ
jgi:type II secretory pathway component PulJ